MSEIYWLTRFDSIENISFLFFILSLLALISSAVAFIATSVCEIDDKISGEDTSEYKEYKNLSKNLLKKFIPSTTVFLLIYIFTPTANEALLIYGVGGTVDYIKQNPTAKQLPDKCVKALDKWVDSWNTEKEDSLENR